MTPGFAAGLAEVGLLFAVLAAVALLTLVVGWSVVAWVDTLRHRRDRERQRLLLADLYQLEVACGGEYPQVEATVDYVRRLVLAEAPVDVVAFRAGLRARYGGGAPEREGGKGGST